MWMSGGVAFTARSNAPHSPLTVNWICCTGAAPQFTGPKIIYAAANPMGGRAGRERITFKQPPYALEV